LVSVLKNLPTLEEPRIYDPLQKSEKEQERIEKVYEKKLNTMGKKYSFYKISGGEELH